MKARKFIPLLVIAAGLLAYQNSFTGAFVHDDFGSITENPTIRHLWPIWLPLSPPQRGGLTVESRPLINLSLAINYALGGYNVWGYHALNLTVHILAGLTLLGVVRRTLLQPALRERFGAVANELALATAVLWTVHPLQTESVTYIVQRAESIMGLLYLLTLYCFIRAAESPHSRPWYGLSLAACALGMASKEVMATAPVMVLLYDRAFLSASFRAAWRRRWPLYLGLASTWILLGFLAAFTGRIGYTSAGAEHSGLTWWQRSATQPGVILYYLRLSAWPSPLSLSHPWPIAGTWMSILLPAVVVILLLGATVWAWKRNPAPLRAGPVWGFVGAWFFLILAPSSSIVPLTDPICERRMYLSLAAVVSLVVTGLYSLVGRRSFAVFIAMAIGLGFLTWRRNQDYQSELTLRVDAATKFPNDPVVYYNLGVALARLDRIPEAIGQFEHALRLNPEMADAHNNLGIALGKAGRVEEQIVHYEQALRLDPNIAEVHYNLGLVLSQTGHAKEAIGEFEEAVRINPDLAVAHNNLAVALVQQGRLPEAAEHFAQAVRIVPDDAETRYNLGGVFVRLGRLPEAIVQWEQAVRINPDLAEAQYNLAVALMQQGRLPEAIEHFEQAVRIVPGMVEGHYNLGVALEQAGQIEKAVEHYQQVLRLKPDYTEAQTRLARLQAAR